MQAAFGHNIDVAAEQCLQVTNKTSREPWACLFPDIHKEVDVAFFVSLTAYDRAEKSNVARSVTMCQVENVISQLKKNGFNRLILCRHLEAILTRFMQKAGFGLHSVLITHNLLVYRRSIIR